MGYGPNFRGERWTDSPKTETARVDMQVTGYRSLLQEVRNLRTLYSIRCSTSGPYSGDLRLRDLFLNLLRHGPSRR
jgi:hypothetical protein